MSTNSRAVAVTVATGWIAVLVCAALTADFEVGAADPNVRGAALGVAS